ncbi:MAG TPA: DUF4293 domain-containing protein [Daejeonella sp.]|nr:DUF4293 domain-containing protein [Daejeonella sp.]
MLQRIQTIWLFFATAAIFSLFLFPIIQVLDVNGAAKVMKVTGLYEHTGGQVVQNQAFLLLTVATVILALIPFVAIFLYRNRPKQILVCYAAIVAIVAYCFWLAQTAKQVFTGIALKIDNYGIGILLPSLAILFMMLAIKGIRKDEKLIKSADRLR